MRHAYLLLPLLLVISLGSFSACDDLFLFPPCEFSMEHTLCNADMSTGLGMQGEKDGGMPDLASPAPLVMKPPVSFTLLMGSALSATRKWVGMRSGNIILFANQTGGMPNANLEVYHLGPSLVDASKLDLIYGAGACPACPNSIQTINVKYDDLLTSKSKLFLVRPDFAYLLNADASVPSESINPVNSKLIGNSFYLRPFVSPNADIFIFQRGDLANDNLQVNFYPTEGNANSVSIAEPIAGLTTAHYYAIGRLDNSRSPQTANQLLIFEDKAVKSAYQIDTSNPSGYIRDTDLVKEINNTIDRATGNKDRFVRSTFIADLNKDGFAELIYTRGPQIYISSYNPNSPTDYKFTEWPLTKLSITGIDVTLTLTATDLTGDGYPELAVETNSPHMVYFFLNNAQ